MFITILFLTIICIVIGVIISKNRYGGGDIFYLIGIPSCIIMLIVTIMLGVCVTFAWGIDEKINLYETENNKIDNQLCEIVENYKGYEKDTFESLKNKNADTLISLYPELKTDTLVKEQIKVYTNNRKEIIKLKQEKIDVKPLRWWLYFGG